MMRHYRGMNRGLCTVSGSFGLGMGRIGLLIRFKPQPGLETELRQWLLEDILPPLPSKSGVGSIHLLERASAAPMTSEQLIRRADAGIDWAIVVTGYSEDALANIMQASLDPARLERKGAIDVADAMYRMDYSLSRDELAGGTQRSGSSR